MVRLTEERVRARAKMADLRNIKQFNLCGSNIDDINIVGRMPNLELLVLSVNNISSLASLVKCTKLRELYLRKNDIKDITEIEFLKGLSALEVLWIEDNPFCEKLGSNYRYVVLRVLPQLIKLDDKDVTRADRRKASSLTEPSFMFESSAAIKGEIEKKLSVQVINAPQPNSNLAIDTTSKDGEYGGSNRQLQPKLNTSLGICLTEDRVIARSKVTKISGIRKFNLCGADLSDISILERMRHIEVLTLTANNISSLAALAECKYLKELYLRKNNINDISELDYLQGLPDLEILWIEQNPFCDNYGSNYRYMVLRVLPNLQMLDNTEVTDSERQKAKNLRVSSLPIRLGASDSAAPREQQPDVHGDMARTSLPLIAEHQQLTANTDITDENKEKTKRSAEKSFLSRNDVGPRKSEDSGEFDEDRPCAASAKKISNVSDERVLTLTKFAVNKPKTGEILDVHHQIAASARKSKVYKKDPTNFDIINSSSINYYECEREFDTALPLIVSTRNTHNPPEKLPMYAMEYSAKKDKLERKCDANLQRVGSDNKMRNLSDERIISPTKYKLKYIVYEKDTMPPRSEMRMKRISEKREIPQQAVHVPLYYTYDDEVGNNRYGMSHSTERMIGSHEERIIRPQTVRKPLHNAFDDEGGNNRAGISRSTEGMNSSHEERHSQTLRRPLHYVYDDESGNNRDGMSRSTGTMKSSYGERTIRPQTVRVPVYYNNDDEGGNTRDGMSRSTERIKSSYGEQIRPQTARRPLHYVYDDEGSNSKDGMSRSTERMNRYSEESVILPESVRKPLYYVYDDGGLNSKDGISRSTERMRRSSEKSVIPPETLRKPFHNAYDGEGGNNKSGMSRSIERMNSSSEKRTIRPQTVRVPVYYNNDEEGGNSSDGMSRSTEKINSSYGERIIRPQTVRRPLHFVYDDERGNNRDGMPRSTERIKSSYGEQIRPQTARRPLHYVYDDEGSNSKDGMSRSTERMNRSSEESVILPESVRKPLYCVYDDGGLNSKDGISRSTERMRRSSEKSVIPPETLRKPLHNAYDNEGGNSRDEMSRSTERMNSFDEERVIPSQTPRRSLHYVYDDEGGNNRDGMSRSTERMRGSSKESVIPPETIREQSQDFNDDEFNNKREQVIYVNRSYTVMRNNETEFNYEADRNLNADQRPMHRTSRGVEGEDDDLSIAVLPKAKHIDVPHRKTS